MGRKAERTVAGALRLALVVLAVIMQLILIVLLVYTLHNYAIYVYLAIEMLAILEIMLLISQSTSSSYTMAWVIIIGLIPVFGQILYILWGRNSTKGRRNDQIRASIANGQGYLDKDSAIYMELGREHPSRKRMAGFLGRKGFPLYKGTGCRYFPLGEELFESMSEDLEKAERYIFMEYFILNSGELWDRLAEILKSKAAKGVEVRVMFDDWGSIITAPDNLIRDLGESGIKAMRWGPIHKYISRLYINYRNHQKITVIDGNIAYTGGVNLADEYANIYERHGHWKDTGIRLDGDAAWSMAVNFLQMWDGEAGKFSDYEKYRPNKAAHAGSGYYQPFSDGPSNNPDNPAESIYRTIISNAREYVYISTPYLVIDNTMAEVLCTSAIGGTDVRIVTPKVWDHWYVHAATQSNYARLLEAGVRIFEYAPGFMHAKTILSDDEVAVTGSINMDYRSFNLHYENGVFICGSPVLENIKRDFTDTMSACEEIVRENWNRRPFIRKLMEGVLRIFSIFL